MSITLPYASAVNCKFVALPDSLATDDNTLKLYNIDGGGGGGTTDAYTKAESDARFLRLAAPAQTISQTPNCAGLKMNPGASLDWALGATGTSMPFRFQTNNGTSVSFNLTNQVDLSSRGVTIPQINTGSCLFLVSSPANDQTIYKKTLNLDYTGGSASGSVLVLKGFGSGVGYGLDMVASTSTNGTKYMRFYAAPSTLRGEIYDNGSGMCYRGNEANVNKLTLNGNSVTDIVTTVTGTSDSKVPSEWAVKKYVDASGSGNAVLKTGAQTMEGPLTVPQLNATTKIVLKNMNIYNVDGNGAPSTDVIIPTVFGSESYFIISKPAAAQTINNVLAVTNSLFSYRLHFSATPSIFFEYATNSITAAQETNPNTVPSSSAVCNWVKSYVAASGSSQTWLQYSYYNNPTNPPVQVSAPVNTFTQLGINTFYVKAYASTINPNSTETVATFALPSGSNLIYQMVISGMAIVTEYNTVLPYKISQTLFKNNNNTIITISDNTSTTFTDVTGLQAVPKFAVNGTNVELRLIKNMQYYSYIVMKVDVTVSNMF